MDDAGRASLEKMQRGEATESEIYSALASMQKSENNRQTLSHIASDEKRHYGLLKAATGKEFAPDRARAAFYTLLARTLGLSFALKLMENGEKGAQENYALLAPQFPKAAEILLDEEGHESRLIDMLSEERLEYASAIVLGLNDALVELTGALVGLTLAFQNAGFIAVSGLVIGVAAALSMAASSYLSFREEGAHGERTPLRASAYTGATYMLTVILLVAPYFALANVYYALACMVALALAIIASYTFYISTAKNQPFLSRFAEMAAISLAVSAISFGVGYVARSVFGLGG
jgi:VIT1/CCC1 family predicted Fe2+/Mn2+ transporter